MKIRCLMVLMAAFATVAFSATAESVFCCGGTIAQVADGALWKTTITLVNFQQSPATYVLRFYSDSGQVMFLPTNVGTVSTISGVLQRNQSIVYETAGAQPNLQQGWAYVDTLDHIGGTGVFRFSIPGLPAVESAAPVDTSFANDFILPFDHVDASTGVCLANNSTFSGITVTLILRDSAGTQLQVDAFQLGALNHVCFMLDQRYQASLGKRGTFEILGSGYSLGVLGLRSMKSAGTITLTTLAAQSPL